jgi:predicted metal-dependent hydrolase
VPWIRQQQKKFREQERETPREYIDRESHYVWGQRYLLKLVETDGSPSVELSHRRLVLKTRPGSSRAKKAALLDAWYREHVKAAASPQIAKWERLMRVKVQRFFVQRMKTKWGSCNRRNAAIRLNTDLDKKPRALFSNTLSFT